MNFYQRTGSGRCSEDEQMMIAAIERLIIQKQIPESIIPKCHNLDDLIELKLYLDGYEPSQEQEPEMVQDSEAETIDSEAEIFGLDNGNSDSEEVPDAETQPIHTEPEAVKEPDAFISAAYDPFADQIVERSYTQADSNTTAPNSDPDEELILDEQKGDPLSDLPPHTKRRAAEQTANTLLKAYAQIAPAPFKWWAKFPEEKIEKMAFNGELDLSLEVSEGITFDDYVKQSNAQLDAIFEVDDDTLNDIREPLIDVLMEQNLELTPTQRLVAAVFSHIMQMVTVAFKLSKENNRILSYQKHLTFLMKGAQAA